MTGSTIHPVARAAAAGLGVAGAVLNTNVYLLGVGWLFLASILLYTGKLREHLRFLIPALVPIAIPLWIVWGWIVAAPPGSPMHSSPAGGLEFATQVTLRLAVISGILHLALVTIPATATVSTLRRAGLRGNALFIAVSTFALVPELRLRSRQVYEAQLARGLLKKTNFLYRARQLPHTLVPLLAWVLRSAVSRSELWEQRGTIALLDHPSSSASFSALWSGAFLMLAALWLTSVLVLRFHS